MISLVNGNSLSVPLRSGSVHMVAFSPPYWGLRSYLDEADPAKAHELGDEPLHDCLGWAKGERPCGGCFVCNLRQVAAEVWRVLRDDGTFWLNLGDSYAGSNNGSNDYRENGISISKNDNKYKGQKPGLSNGLKPKDLAGIPWRVALALQADGWYLRNDVVWSKPNPMPESVTDRPTKAHEYIFLLSKQARYFYDAEAVMETATGYDGRKDVEYKGGAKDVSIGKHTRWKRKADGTGSGGDGTGFQNHSGYSNLANPFVRNRRSVWTVATEPYSGAHFATWPTALVEIMVRAGTSEKGACPSCGAQWRRVLEKSEPEPAPNTRTVSTVSWQPGCGCGCEPVPAVVLDLFAGSGTTLEVARRLGRSGVGVDLNFDYLVNQARCRLDLDRLEALEQGEGYIRPLKPSRPRKVLAGQMSLL